MKKNVLILIILTVAMIALILVIVIAKPLDEKLSGISAIEVSTQNTGGVMSTNYMPILEESIDWAALSDDERADIARAAVRVARDQAEQDGITKFNVIGLSRPGNEPIFLYYGDESLFVYVNGEATVIPIEE
ncbi:hypothetical protein AGMMS49983_21590 [Clostridia bacterium]|nr:hypothetical protein AGMMS49983_21590 [Clostridia bacterium]